MRSVLGVDLGASWHTLGSALLSFDEARWTCCISGAIAWPDWTCNAGTIADAIVGFALKNNICAISLDGPQGWRDPVTPGSFVGRECEKLTKTPGRTGTFGVAKPQTWIRWIQCSIEVFDRLLGSQRAILANSPESQVLAAPPDGKFYILECFPTSTWRQAGLKPLPGHHIDIPTIQQFARDLREVFELPDIAPRCTRDQSEHDDLQALVAALPAAGLLGGPCKTVPMGLPARTIVARNEIPAHRAEGIIWDAAPNLDLGRSAVIREAVSIAPNPQPLPTTATKSSGNLAPNDQGVERGVRLFTYLAELSNRGDAAGVSYGGFIAYLHDVAEFREVAGRNFLPSDGMAAVRIAWSITEAAGGRKKIARSGTAIDAGMDTFIWNAKRPFDRPVGAWNYSIPYTRSQWLSIFPDGARRLITVAELQMIAGRR